MTTTDAAPAVVLEPATLGDLELVLHGVLPSGHLLGGPISSGMPSARDPQDAPPVARLPVPAATADAALAASGLTLADHELTPLATLHDLTVGEQHGASVEVAGWLAPRRSRESGAGRRLALREQDRAAGFARVVVLGRPVLDGDLERLRPDRGATLVVVPDDPRSTAGVPTDVMLGIAQRLADTLGDAEVRTAPLRWRSPDSDRTLTRLLAEHLGATESLLLHAHPDVDTAGAAWTALRSQLDEARTDGIPLAGLSAADARALRRWRPPRPRRGLVVMFTGLSGSGKSTLARGLSEHLTRTSERTVTLLDGDIVRQLLSSGLGFDRESRILNVRRIGFVAAEVARHGGTAVCAPVAPYAVTRGEVRAMAEAVGDFVLVHVSTPLAECERRDLKGFYAKARAGLVPEFTGISDPYEAPDDADLSIDTTHVSPQEALDMLDTYLRTNGWLEGTP